MFKYLQIVGDCPTFSVPLTLRTPKTIEILLKGAEYYKIFMYQRGWFQKLFQKTAMPYNYVGKGEHINLFMNIQMAKFLPIEGIYKYTAADDNKDCKDNPDYDLDILVAKIVHQKFNQTFGCALPFWGGIYQNMTYDMCTNTSLYSLDLILPIYNGKFTSEICLR